MWTKKVTKVKYCWSLTQILLRNEEIEKSEVLVDHYTTNNTKVKDFFLSNKFWTKISFC